MGREGSDTEGWLRGPSACGGGRVQTGAANVGHPLQQEYRLRGVMRTEETNPGREVDRRPLTSGGGEPRGSTEVSTFRTSLSVPSVPLLLCAASG